MLSTWRCNKMLPSVKISCQILKEMWCISEQMDCSLLVTQISLGHSICSLLQNRLLALKQGEHCSGVEHRLFYKGWQASGFQWECTPCRCHLVGVFPPCEWIDLFLVSCGRCWLDNSSAVKFQKLVDGKLFFLFLWLFCWVFFHCWCLGFFVCFFICFWFFFLINMSFYFSYCSLNETRLGFLAGWNELNWFCHEDFIGVFAFGFILSRVWNPFTVSSLQGACDCRLFTYLHYLILRSSLSFFLQLSVLVSLHLSGLC